MWTCFDFIKLTVLRVVSISGICDLSLHNVSVEIGLLTLICSVLHANNFLNVPFSFCNEVGFQKLVLFVLFIKSLEDLLNRSVASLLHKLIYVFLKNTCRRAIFRKIALYLCSIVDAAKPTTNSALGMPAFGLAAAFSSFDACFELAVDSAMVTLITRNPREKNSSARIACSSRCVCDSSFFLAH